MQHHCYLVYDNKNRKVNLTELARYFSPFSEVADDVISGMVVEQVSMGVSVKFGGSTLNMDRINGLVAGWSIFCAPTRNIKYINFSLQPTGSR